MLLFCDFMFRFLMAQRFWCDVDGKDIVGIRYRCAIHEEFDTCAGCRFKHPCPMLVVFPPQGSSLSYNETATATAAPSASASSASAGAPSFGTFVVAIPASAATASATTASAAAAPVAPQLVIPKAPVITCYGCKKAIHFERFSCSIGCFGASVNFCSKCYRYASTLHSHSMMSHLVGATKTAAEAFWLESDSDIKIPPPTPPRMPMQAWTTPSPAPVCGPPAKKSLKAPPCLVFPPISGNSSNDPFWVYEDGSFEVNAVYRPALPAVPATDFPSAFAFAPNASGAARPTFVAPDAWGNVIGQDWPSLLPLPQAHSSFL